ncbi:MAG: hypothetical protein GWN86_04220, partial [Desulfobacterales bacterium]|nr:hypothetical protein [Desulfobacterales bacterium]
MDNNKGKGYDADVEAVKGLYHPISEKQEENIQHGEVRVCYLDKRTGEWKPVIKKKPKEQQNGRGWISVSYELLAHVLKLPKDVKITRVDAGL